MTACFGILLFAAGLHGYFLTAAKLWQRAAAGRRRAAADRSGTRDRRDGRGPCRRRDRLAAIRPACRAKPGQDGLIGCRRLTARPATAPPHIGCSIARTIATFCAARSAGSAAPTRPASIPRATTPATISRAATPTATPITSAPSRCCAVNSASTVDFIRSLKPRPGGCSSSAAPTASSSQEAQPHYDVSGIELADDAAAHSAGATGFDVHLRRGRRGRRLARPRHVRRHRHARRHRAPAGPARRRSRCATRHLNPGGIIVHHHRRLRLAAGAGCWARAGG